MPTPLEVALALRATSDWIRHAPDHQRAYGSLAQRPKPDHGLGVTTSCHPLDPRATSWCALGRFWLELGLDHAYYEEFKALVGADPQSFYHAWDHAGVTCYNRRHRQLRAEWHERAAAYCDQLASQIEAQIPTTRGLDRAPQELITSA